MSDLLVNEVAAEATPTAPATGRTAVFRRIIRNPFGLVSLIWLVAVVVVALAADQIAPYSATEVDFTQLSSGPTSAHLLGTDTLGRDVLSRLMFGARPTLEGLAVAIAVFTLVGLSLGLTAGYRGGWFDTVVGRVTEVLLSLPGFILLLVVLAVFGNKQAVAMVALGLLCAPALIRVARSVTLSVREELFISAAKVFGLTDLTIVVRHVLPRIRSAVIVQVALFGGIALLYQSGLAFLGFGPQPPDPSWGGMLSDASIAITTQPWQIAPAGAAIGISIMALGLLGNAVRDAVAETWSHSHATLLRRTHMPRSAGVVAEVVPSAPLVQVRGLSISSVLGGERRAVVRSVDLDIDRGETVGVVGESGCGKTLTSLGLVGALPPGTELAGGSVYLDGRDLAAMSSDERDRVRGRRIGYVSQEPARALDPMFTVGSQLREAVRRHHGGTRREAHARALELLEMVRLPQPETIARKYPHQLSGGMAQRAVIALALAGGPDLLVADEPTTALDVTTQAEILKLLRTLQQETGMAILLVTHDWGVVAEMCDRAVVMYAGEVVETGAVTELLERPKHPYTAALLGSNPYLLLESGGDEPASSEAIRLLPTIPGEVPAPGSWGSGCAFASRCSYATAECRADAIPLLPIGPGHEARCIHSSKVTPMELVTS